MEHRVAPLAGWKKPMLHGTHVALPLFAAKEPGVHSIGAALPAGAQWPASTSVQEAALVRPLAFAKCPFAHGRGCTLRTGQ